MCEKQPNETTAAYLCRLIIEQPRSVLAVVALAGCAVLYNDFRGLLQQQQASQTEMVRVLTTLTDRIETLEKTVDRIKLPQQSPAHE